MSKIGTHFETHLKQSVYPSVHLSIHPSTYLYIYLLTYQKFLTNLAFQILSERLFSKYYVPNDLIE